MKLGNHIVPDTGLWWEPVRVGDCIGIIAPSAPIHPEAMERGIRQLEGFGYQTKTVLTPSAEYGSKRHLFSSAAARERCEALASLIEDSDVRAILTAKGAYGSIELLPELHLELLNQDPKPIVGFSDVTALLNAYYQSSKVITVHGPTLQTFGNTEYSSEHSDSFQRLFRLLERSADPLNGVVLEQLGTHAFEAPVGPLVGGNLSILSALVGTPWQLDAKGHIVFFEEVGERPYRIHRMLLQMKLAGVFEGAQAVVVGHLTDCEHKQGLGPTSVEVLQDIFQAAPFPVFVGLPCGHESRNCPVPIGAPVQIELDGRIHLVDRLP